MSRLFWVFRSIKRLKIKQCDKKSITEEEALEQRKTRKNQMLRRFKLCNKKSVNAETKKFIASSETANELARIIFLSLSLNLNADLFSKNLLNLNCFEHFLLGTLHSKINNINFNNDVKRPS